VKYALITDIHGNLEALEQVLKKIEVEACDKIICLGDVVGYGPFPNECVEQVRDKANSNIVGNHDSAAIAMTDISSFNENAGKAIIWTRRQLTSANQHYLADLSLTWSEPGAFFVHASPKNPVEWRYIFLPDDVDDAFHSFNQKVCFFGHTHIPVTYYFDSVHASYFSLNHTEIDLNETGRFLINVGSVGQPRDGNPQAAFGIYNSNTGIYRHLRVDYDIRKTQKAMEQFHLPRFLIQRLQKGR
jgi:predicted phosphodiesterase